jgi:phage terminase large subunit-like protein
VEKIPNDRFINGLHDAQLDVLAKFDGRLKRFFILKWHRRARKTTLILNILIRECLRNRKSVYPYVAPTYTQAKAIVWRDPNMLFSCLPDRREVAWQKNESELFIKFPNGSVLPIKGGDDPDSLRGIDAKGVGFDEWALMKEVIWTEIFRPIITEDPNRWAMFGYTPKGENHATVQWRKAQKWSDWYRSFLPASRSGLIPKPELEKARREMPPWLYDQEFECKDISDEEFVLISSAMLDALRDVGLRVYPDERRIIACDPDSSIGGDECVIYAMENKRRIDENIMHERDTTKIAFCVETMARKHDTDTIIVDNIGIGKGVYDNLTNARDWDVIAFDSRERAADSERFFNRRAEAWWYLMEQVMNKELDYPEDLLLRQDLSSVRLKPGSRRIQLELKQETKRRLGRSPDRGDAFVMGVWGDQFVIPKRKRTKRDKWAFESKTESAMAM